MQVQWIEASAGCGKTTFLLNNYRLSPNSSLFITFSKAAAEEIKCRLNDNSVKITTLHALAYEILKLYKPINQLTGKYLSTQALSILLKDKVVFQLFEWLNRNSDGVISKIEVPDVTISPKAPQYYSKKIAAIFEDALMEKKDLDEIKYIFLTKQDTLRKKISIPEISSEESNFKGFICDCLERIDLHEKLIHKYAAQVKNQLYDVLIKKEEELKYSLGVVYYDDLIKEVASLVKKSGEVVFQFLGNIQKIYIDEAQDLSKDQLELVFSIINEWKVTDGDLYVAGDPKQLIYEFQGASIDEFKKFKIKLISISKSFNEIKLNVTHRLAKGLCDFVNKIGKDLDIGYEDHITKKETDGEVKVVFLDEYDDIIKYITTDSMVLFKQKHAVIEALALKLMKRGLLLNSPYIVSNPIIREFQHLVRWLAYNNPISLGAIFINIFDKKADLDQLMLEPEMEFINSLNYDDLTKLFVNWIAYEPVDNYLHSKLKYSYDFFIDVLRRYAEYYRYTPYEAIFDLNDFFSSNSNLFEDGIFFNTIHSSKGKEAKRVILIDTDKRSKFKSDTDRLMYVALTRAKEELLIPILRENRLNTWAEIFINKLENQNYKSNQV
ncbi:UvrD-helicase domain-containing protein [Alphaproteobacteria bacterium endosymbiont of Tiliacea citrago]|uniref:UvrD-helicase domain-containing protein n=1 Tax=Alphaproteobacteria bacterium endosymbiont of Tiliacea citrago TaxID=3077944 RepID=UPI00313B85C5